MYIARMAGLGAAPTLAPSADVIRKALSRMLVSSDMIDGRLIDKWQDTKTSDPGYDAKRGCYYWGHRPEPVMVLGVGGLGAVWQGGGTFKVCPPGDCPAPKACPTPPPCPACGAEPPVGLSPSPSSDDESLLGKYGVNIGLLVAGTLTAGVGYYGYKKGWFKRKRR